MKRQAILTKSVGTKVSGAELSLLENCARDRGLTLSTWARRSLLAAAVEAQPSGDVIALAEVLALRSIAINLLFSISQGQAVTAETMKALIERADAEKMRRAAERLSAERQPENETMPNAMEGSTGGK
jgi:hypothetical protein